VTTRLKGVLAMVVALVMLAASSQATVCELACGLQIKEMNCHAAPNRPATSDSVAMGMNHAHCGHGMKAQAMQQAMRSVADCDDASCSHASIPVLAKSGSTAAQFSAVQWVAVAVVQGEPGLSGWGVGVGKRPPSRPGGMGSLSVSLRV
jgi:hypothetical protein